MIMQLASILDQYRDAFQAKYGARLLPSHLRAIERSGDGHPRPATFVQCLHTVINVATRSVGTALPAMSES
jgi:hypothetical protein